MIEVGAQDHDVTRPDGVRPRQDADHVGGPPVLPDEVHADVRLDTGGERSRPATRRQPSNELIDGLPRGRQQPIGARRRDGTGHEANRHTRGGQRRQRVLRDQDDAGGAGAPRRHELLEPGRPRVGQVGWRALQREGDLVLDVHAGVVVVATLGLGDAVPDEDDLRGHLAGDRPAVGHPVAAGVQARRRCADPLELGPRPDGGHRRQDEGLKEAATVAARSNSQSGQSIGDVARRPLVSGRARAPALHLRSGESMHVSRQLTSSRRNDGGLDPCDDEGQRQCSGGERGERAAGHRAIVSTRPNAGGGIPTTHPPQ